MKKIKVTENSVIHYNSEKEMATIIKLNDDLFLYEAELVAGELINIVQEGEIELDSLIQQLVNTYPDKYSDEIRKKSKDLVEELINKEILEYF